MLTKLKNYNSQHVDNLDNIQVKERDTSHTLTHLLDLNSSG